MIGTDNIKIALVGKKAAGKSFVASYLSQQYGFKRVKMQDGVDRIIKMMYGWHKYKRPTWEQRYYIYDALYKVDPNIHINYLLTRLETTTRNVVVEDARYINEVQTLGDKDFKIIRVTLDEGVRQRRIGRGLLDAAAGSVILTEYFNTDPARAYKVDYNLINSTREATKRSVDDLIKKLT